MGGGIRTILPLWGRWQSRERLTEGEYGARPLHHPLRGWSPSTKGGGSSSRRLPAYHRFAQQIDAPGIDPDRDCRDAALVLAECLAGLQRDVPVVQRAGDDAAMDDALAQRTLLVRALVDQRVEAVVEGVEDRDLLTPADRQG